MNIGSNYFTWYVQYINANTEGLYQASSGSSSWSPVNDKLLFTYESITIGSNNQPFVYTAPAAVDLTYNGNSVTSTSNNLLDLKTNTAIFTSNDSIVFDFTYQIHYSRANPIVTTITYAVANNTNPNWNVTATTDSIPSGSYSVSNRTFMLYSLPSDWNTTSVTQNDSLFTDLIYSNGSSILLLNVTSNISAYFWSMNFVSPNYMSTLTLLQNNTKTLSSPYQINTTDTLHVLATMTSKATGTNGSLLVYDPTNIINFTMANVAIISDQLNFSLWNVSQTLTSNGNPDGIYTIKAQWINTSQLELGYLTTSVQVITQTGLSASSDAGNYLTGQVIHLTGNFFSYLNNTPLNNAILAYKVGWNSTSGLLIQNGDHQDYSANITVDPSVPIGLAFITINATLSGYVNRTTQVSFNIVHNATLSYQIVENQIFYGDSVDIKIFYNDSITNTFLNQSTITVNGSIHSATLQGQGTGQYYLISTDTANIVP